MRAPFRRVPQRVLCRRRGRPSRRTSRTDGLPLSLLQSEHHCNNMCGTSAPRPCRRSRFSGAMRGITCRPCASLSNATLGRRSGRVGWIRAADRHRPLAAAAVRRRRRVTHHRIRHTARGPCLAAIAGDALFIIVFWSARALSTVLVTRDHVDLWSIGVAAGVLVAAGTGAVLPAALRAAHTDPLIALRAE